MINGAAEGRIQVKRFPFNRNPLGFALSELPFNQNPGGLELSGVHLAGIFTDLCCRASI